MSKLARAAPDEDGPSDLNVACSSCGLRELCLPVGFSDQEMARLDGLVARKLRVARGEPLYRSGQAFDAVFAVRTGFFKTRTGGST